MALPSPTEAELRARGRPPEVVAEPGEHALEAGDLGRPTYDAAAAGAGTPELVGSATGTADPASQPGRTPLSEEPVADDPSAEERFRERSAERHGGVLRVGSGPDEGTTVSFPLPEAGDDDG